MSAAAEGFQQLVLPLERLVELLRFAAVVGHFGQQMDKSKAQTVFNLLYSLLQYIQI